MTPQEILQACRASGVTLGMDAEGGLSVKGPPADIARLAPSPKAHKPALLALLAGKRAEPAPLPRRWRAIHQSGTVRELDAPSGLAESEARSLEEELGGPVENLEPMTFQGESRIATPPQSHQTQPDPNAIAADLAREHDTTPADALAILDDGDKAAIRAGDPAMIEAWKSAVALVGKAGPLPGSKSVPCRICRHWTPDRINPPAGLGRCDGGSRTLAWPNNSCQRGEAR